MSISGLPLVWYDKEQEKLGKPMFMLLIQCIHTIYTYIYSIHTIDTILNSYY